jgi:hypothetical protein
MSTRLLMMVSLLFSLVPDIGIHVLCAPDELFVHHANLECSQPARLHPGPPHRDKTASDPLGDQEIQPPKLLQYNY